MIENVDIKRGMEILQNGDLLVIPTDTVFGIAADVFNERGVKKIFEIKKRSEDKAIPILVDSVDTICRMTKDRPYNFEEIAGRFWPGALSCVLSVREEVVPKIVRGGKSTAAFRIPKNLETQRLIAAFGPLAVTSVNYSGEEELSNVEEIARIFNFPILLSPYSLLRNLPSTVIEFIEGKWEVLRKGSVAIDFDTI